MEATESTAPVETTEVDSEVVATGGEGAAPSGSADPAPGTPEWRDKNQERIDKLTQKERLASDRAYRADAPE